MTETRFGIPMLLATILVAAPAAAGNLLQNPQFNTNLTGWSNFGTTPFWSADDRHGSPTSGSMAIIAGGDIPVGAFQCIQLPHDGVFQLAIDHRRAVGGTAAWGWILVDWYSGTNCTGLLGSNSTFAAASSSWQRLSQQWPAAALSMSAGVAILSQDTGAGPELHFDNAYFGVPVIFEDGFESADTSRWSASVP